MNDFVTRVRAEIAHVEAQLRGAISDAGAVVSGGLPLARVIAYANRLNSLHYTISFHDECGATTDKGASK